MSEKTIQLLKAGIIDAANKIIEKADWIEEEANRQSIHSVSFNLNVYADDSPQLDMMINYIPIGDEMKKLYQTFTEKL